jgi:uncharacterized membrane protein YhdT
VVIAMLKKIVQRLDISIWALPTLILYILMMVLFVYFKATDPNDGQGYFLEPGSGREVIFESIIGLFFITYLWVLLYRLSSKGKRSLSRWTKGSVILLTALFILGWFCQLLLYFHR